MREIPRQSPQLSTAFPGAAHRGDVVLRPPPTRDSLFPLRGTRSSHRTGGRRTECNDRARVFAPVTVAAFSVRPPSSLAEPAAERRLRRCSAGRSTGLNGPWATRLGSGVPGGLNARLCSLSLTPGRRRWGGVRPVPAPLDAPPPRLAVARRGTPTRRLRRLLLGKWATFTRFRWGLPTALTCSWPFGQIRSPVLPVTYGSQGSPHNTLAELSYALVGVTTNSVQPLLPLPHRRLNAACGAVPLDAPPA